MLDVTDVEAVIFPGDQTEDQVLQFVGILIFVDINFIVGFPERKGKLRRRIVLSVVEQVKRVTLHISERDQLAPAFFFGKTFFKGAQESAQIFHCKRRFRKAILQRLDGIRIIILDDLFQVILKFLTEIRKSGKMDISRNARQSGKGHFRKQSSYRFVRHALLRGRTDTLDHVPFLRNDAERLCEFFIAFGAVDRILIYSFVMQKKFR